VDQALEGCSAVIECRVRGGGPATAPFFSEDQTAEKVQASHNATEVDDVLGGAPTVPTALLLLLLLLLLPTFATFMRLGGVPPKTPVVPETL
jgi:hypothetical protein